MSWDHYEVTTELDARSFESTMSARALVRRVRVELRRLEHGDRRISRPRVRRSRSSSRGYEVSLRVAGWSYSDAVDHCIVALRTAVHAAGGSSATWNGVNAHSGLVTAGGDGTVLRSPWEPPAVWSVPIDLRSRLTP